MTNIARLHCKSRIGDERTVEIASNKEGKRERGNELLWGEDASYSETGMEALTGQPLPSSSAIVGF